MKKFIIAFLGNREVFDENKILNAILDQLEDFLQPWNTTALPERIVFYCGGYGRFDGLASQAIDLLRNKYPDFKAEKYLIIPYCNPAYLKRIAFLKKCYDDFIYPPIETAPPKYVIQYRNRWIIDKSDYIIAYMQNPFGNTKKLIAYARAHRKNVVLLNHS